MPIAKHEVLPLFSEPIFRATLEGVISKEQVEFIKNLKMVRNQVNLISENLYIFELPELASIKKAVQEVLDLYAREVMGISQKLYVTQSWSLINPPGVGMHGHTHSNSLISGSLYYTDLPTPPSRMIFDRYSSYRQIEIWPEQGKVNIFNTTKNAVIPGRNDILLFSSHLQHMVEPNASNEPRHSIAFNTFVKGKLGDYRDVSELNLT